MRVFLLQFALMTSTALFGQTEKLDSLKSVLESDLSADELIDTNVEIMKYYQNPNEKLIYAKRAYTAASDASMEGKMMAATKMGVCYGMLGVLDSSEVFFRETLDLGLEASDSSYVSRGYNGLGNIYRIKGELEQALGFLLRAIEYGEGVPVRNWNADIIANVSGVYYDLRDYESALEKANEARALYMELGDSANISYSANILAIVHRALGNLDEALRYNREALRILIESKDTVQIVYNYNTNVEILMEQGRLDEAAEYANRTVEMSQKFGERDPYISALTTLASIYYRQDKIDQAEEALERALKEAREYSFKTQIPNIYLMKALIAASNGQNTEAFDLMEQRTQINDSIRSSEVSDRMAELNMKYETEKKEAEIERLNAKQEQSRRVNYIILSGTAFILIALIVIWYSYRQRMKISAELQRANDAKDRLLSVVAHDIKNPLSAMKGISGLLNEEYQSLAEDQKREMIAAIDSSSDKLYELLQNLLDWSISETGGLSFNPEKQSLKQIAEEAISLFQPAIAAKELTVHNNISKNVFVRADYKMIFSVFRNLLANAIIFTPNQKDVFLEAVFGEGEVKICVRDTGKGIEAEQQEDLFTKRESSSKSGTGLGLILCKEFVERHDGKIWVESTEGEGASFYFTIPAA